MKQIVALLLLLSFALAADVAVGTYILNIGNYDIATGSYDADFYLWFRGTDIPTTFEFMNGEATSMTTIIDDPGYKVYRVRATLYSTPDFSQYPNDEQTLSIIIEDSLNTTNEVNYTQDEAIGVSETMSVLGWDRVGSGVKIGSSYYGNWGESYPRYEHYVTIARPVSSLFKFLLPALFIALVSWMMFFIPRKNFDTRVLLGFSALLSAVTLHMTVTSSVPPVGMLMLADKMMIALYGFILATMAAVVLVEVLRDREKQRDATMVDRWSILLTLFVPFIVFWLIYGL